MFVCVCPAGMRFFVRNMCGIVGITGTAKLDGRLLFGLTLDLDWWWWWGLVGQETTVMMKR